MNMNEIVTGVTMEKVCSIKADADCDTPKTINLVVKFDGVKLGDVFSKAMAGAVIQWQNGPGRSKFDTWRNNQRVEITFSAPGRTTVDPEQAQIAKLKGMETQAEKEAYIQWLMEQANN